MSGSRDIASSGSPGGHYGRDNLCESILASLAAHGIEAIPGAVSRESLARLDEFHSGGREATRRLAALAQILPGRHVLDCGSGLGGPARTLAAERDAFVTGIEMAASYCFAARMLSRLTGLQGRTAFVRGRLPSLPVREDSVDVAWMQHVMVNVADRRRLLAEMRRVLRADGSLALSEPCAGPAGRPHYPTFWAARDGDCTLRTPAELRRELEDGGFEVREMRDVSAQALAFTRARDGGGGPGLSVAVGPAARERGGNAARNLAEGRVVVIEAVLVPARRRSRPA